MVFSEGSLSPLHEKYKALKSRESITGLNARLFAERLVDLFTGSMAFLRSECAKISLVSQVPGKQYFAFRRTDISGTRETIRTSRPINAGLFVDEREMAALLKHFELGNYDTLDPHQITALLYTMSIAFCAVNDVTKSGDKKTPATFFELFVAHLVARQFNALPRKKVRVPSVEDRNADLPTDVVFELGKGQVKFHVPVKLSTRERVIQAWAHQRVLAGLWGESEFKGLLVVLNETKLDLKDLKVVEICLPLQWTVYQRYIARLDRAYYFDLPRRYAGLASGHPRIDVKEIGLFFKEKEALLAR